MTANGALVAGVDSSTQSTTVVVIDAETGVQVARGRAPHEVTGTGGARESDPNGWWTALRDALAMTGHAREIAAISIGAQQHGLVVVDAAGRAAAPRGAMERHPLGGPDRGAGGGTRSGSMGGPHRVGAGALLHRHAVGVAA